MPEDPIPTPAALSPGLDPIVMLLCALLVFLTLCLFASEVWFKSDGQFFQVVSGMATGVLGALLGIITGHAKSTQVVGTQTQIGKNSAG